MPPTALQVVPFQLANALTLTPPALEKLPPAYSSPLLSIAKVMTWIDSPTVDTYGPGSTPVPSACHWLPSQRAMQLAGVSPTALKLPPMYTLVP